MFGAAATREEEYEVVANTGKEWDGIVVTATDHTVTEITRLAMILGGKERTSLYRYDVARGSDIGEGGGGREIS